MEKEARMKIDPECKALKTHGPAQLLWAPGCACLSRIYKSMVIVKGKKHNEAL